MTKEESHKEFSDKLAILIHSITQFANSQFDYNWKENVHKGIVEENLRANHAINSGLVSAINSMGKWDTNFTIRFAMDLLEDCNLPEAVKALTELKHKKQTKQNLI